MCAHAYHVLQDKLMELPNTNWQQTLDQVAASPHALELIEVQNTLHNLLQSNVSVCQSMGGFFMQQMVRLFTPMLEVYARLSHLINNGIQHAGPLGAQHSTIKAMRSVKKTALKLIEAFVDNSEMDDHLTVIRTDFVPALMKPILSDYQQSLPDAKCVLALYSSISSCIQIHHTLYAAPVNPSAI
jgi:exportin-1